MQGLGCKGLEFKVRCLGFRASGTKHSELAALDSNEVGFYCGSLVCPLAEPQVEPWSISLNTT